MSDPLPLPVPPKTIDERGHSLFTGARADAPLKPKPPVCDSPADVLRPRTESLDR